MIYFDNAATGGVKPQAVITAFSNALKVYSANPGRSSHEASVRAAKAVFDVRQKTADFFGADGPENVIFTLNCTHAVNCVLKGVLRRGDHVIVSNFEHNAVMRPLAKLGVLYDVAGVSMEDDDKTVDEFKKLIKPNTRMIFCTGASNVTGKILPIARIGALCHKRGLLFGVDAAQIAGMMTINVKEMNIDYLCVAPHKGLYTPMGVGVLIAQKSIENTIIEGGTGTNSLDLFQPEYLPEKLESGTLNLPGIIALGEGLEYTKKTGINTIYTHEMKLIGRIYNAMSKMEDINLYTPPPRMQSFVPVLSFNFKGVPSGKTAELLAENHIAVRGGFHCAGMAHKALRTDENGTVRISLSAFNTVSEVEDFLRLIRNKKFREKLKKVID